MKVVTRLFLLSWIASAVVACGGGAKLGGGKEGAAQAASQLGQAGGTGANGALAELPAQGATFMSTVEVACPNGGRIGVGVNVDLANPLNSGWMFRYMGCSVDGKNFYNGELNYTWTLSSGDPTGTSFAFSVGLRGKVDISGVISDTLTVDFTESISLESNTLSITIDGSIATSTASYTYTNESFSFAFGAELRAYDPDAGF
jgi:hypothetical protein